MLDLSEQFYTYLWLREDGTPYYVGKGSKVRAFVKHDHRCPVPSDRSRILIQYFVSEADAFTAEVFLIEFYGRKDLGTGCLRNLTNGGEKPPITRHNKGKSPSKETRQKISESQKTKANYLEWVEKLSLAKKGKPSPNKGKHWKHKKPHSLAHRQQISLRQIGRKLSIETRAKMSAKKRNRHPWNYGLRNGQPTDKRWELFF